MNKHALNYHTLLHEWYRQHSILQEQQQNSGPDLVPPQVDGTRNLTKDKFHFINEWCSEVNNSFFNIKKKESKSALELRDQDNSTSYRDRSTSLNSHLYRLSDVSIQSGRFDAHLRALSQHERLLQTTRLIPYSGDEIKVTASSAKKPIRTSEKVRHLELCIKNSKAGVMDNKDLSRVSRDSFIHRDDPQSFKRNEGRSSARNMNYLGYCTLTRNINSLHSNYRLTSVVRHVRNETVGLTNRRSVVTNVISKDGSQTTQNNMRPNLDLQKSEEYLIKDAISTSSQEYYKTLQKDLANQDSIDDGNSRKPVRGVRHHVKQETSIYSSSPCESICSGDRESSSTPASQTECMRQANTGINHNIDLTAGISALNKRVQMKTQIFSSPEKNLEKKVMLGERESMQLKSLPKKDTINFNTNSYSNTRRDTKQPFLIPNAYNGINNNISIDIEKKISIDNAVGDIKISTENEVSQNNETKQSNGENKTRENDIIQKVKLPKRNNYLEGSNKQSLDERSNLGALSLTSTNDVDRCKSSVPIEEPTISNISLSNNLLNMLSIDDCKISMRYTLHKINPRINQDGKDDSNGTTEINNSSKFSFNSEGKVASTTTMMKTNKVSRRTASVLRHSSGRETISDRNKCKTMLVNNDGQLGEKNIPHSTRLETAFHTLINNRTTVNPISLTRSKNRKVTRTVNCETDGPVYRRLHGALRKHMEEVVQAQCTTLQTKYKTFASDIV